MHFEKYTFYGIISNENIIKHKHTFKNDLLLNVKCFTYIIVCSNKYKQCSVNHTRLNKLTNEKIDKKC